MPDKMTELPTITTERLTLRQPQDSDVESVFAIHSDVRTYEHRPELVMKSREEAVELISIWQQDWRQDGIGYFVVSTREGETIGFTGVRRAVQDGEAVLNLYYRFAPEAQGKGKAAEAARAAIDWARPQYPELPIVAIIDPTNVASARLAKRLGLRRDPDAGVAGDYQVYRC